MSAEVWIAQATAEEIRAKIEEYEKLGDLGSQRENGLRSSLVGKLRIALKSKEAHA